MSLTPHGEPYDQVKPFTPFKVRVSVRSFHDHGESFFVLLYLDGELAQRKILDSNHFCHDFLDLLQEWVTRVGSVHSSFASHHQHDSCPRRRRNDEARGTQPIW